MPVGATDYRERLRGPGTHDVLAMILRGLARSPQADNPELDPETGKAVAEMFGRAEADIAPRPLRPDEQAAIADRKAREAYQRIIGY